MTLLRPRSWRMLVRSALRQHAAPAPADAAMPRGARSAARRRRAAAGADDRELDVQPLRDPQVRGPARGRHGRHRRARLRRGRRRARPGAADRARRSGAAAGARRDRAAAARLRRAETLAQRAFELGSKVGPLCRRHWATIEQAASAAAQTPSAHVQIAPHVPRAMSRTRAATVRPALRTPMRPSALHGRAVPRAAAATQSRPGSVVRPMSQLAQASRAALTEGGALASQLALRAARGAAAPGHGGRRCVREPRRAARRGRHRHRQDLRLPGAGAAVGPEDDRLHRHPRAAGPALPPRPAARARRARHRPEDRAAEGPRQLPVPVPDGAGQGRAAASATRASRSRSSSASSRGAGAPSIGDLAELDALPEDSPLLPHGHLHRGQLPRQRMPVLGRLLRGAGAPARAGRRPRGGQPPPAAGRPGAEAGRLRRDPAGRAGVRGRRSAPVAGAGRAVLRRRPRRAAAGGTGARCARRMQGRAGRAGHAAGAGARAGTGGCARCAPRWTACRTRGTRCARAGRAGSARRRSTRLPRRWRS